VLLLFDIDGTLLRGATEAHRDALHAALATVHGIDSRKVRTNLAPAGRTDGEIARALLVAAGVSARRIDERADDVRDECCRGYARLAPADLSHTVLPGVRELLAALSERDNAELALLTGNFEPIARIKLGRAGLADYFASGQGAFGSDSEDRTSLVPIARRRAGTAAHPHPREDTAVIGDTPRDIACARADGVRCAIVATGPFDADQLQHADATVGDAAALRGVLEGWLDVIR
jgi:phosphoglycolate phosphatase-like HAD superfamily hydrolase